MRESHRKELPQRMKNLLTDVAILAQIRHGFPVSVSHRTQSVQTSPKPRLWLKTFSMSDVDLLWQTIQLDRQSAERKDIWPGIESREDLGIYISDGHPGRTESIEFTYLIFDLEGVVLGTFHVHSISWYHRRAELGYWILAAKAGNGFAQEALQLIEPELWSMGFHRLEIRCDPANTRSCRVAEKSGYEFEGTLQLETWTGERFRDTSVYGKVAHLK